ncbi:GxxExxY protein [Sphingobium sp. Cam5-1]|uniref:GxxExxY protein n=1 Tax=Sphingobium sp. Cam5-1 TaxID=2789327 RepID=UPI0018AD170A|nr:GxxExxY protein [Sphingobium sp. Cam5-1]QPI73660.1 GxxExxY protein [Sphingobium sp. Cam5-1]
MRPIDDITRDVIGIAMHIHRELGPGLLESVYEMVLAAKLHRLGYRVDRQRQINMEFDGLRFEAAFRIDILVDERLIVEIKSVEQIHKVHAKQLLTYLRLTRQPVGLILNFGAETMREGIRRLVNNHNDSASSAPLREQIITE